MSQMFLTIKDIMTNNILTEFHKMETQLGNVSYEKYILRDDDEDILTVIFANHHLMSSFSAMLDIRHDYQDIDTVLESSMEIKEDIQDFMENSMKRKYGIKEINKKSKMIKKHLRKIIDGLNVLEYITISMGATLDGDATCINYREEYKRANKLFKKLCGIELFLFNSDDAIDEEELEISSFFDDMDEEYDYFIKHK